MERKYTISILFLGICLIIIIFCPTQKLRKDDLNSSYESQLYASLESDFNYYYSMDLWSFEQIIKKICTMDNDSVEDRYYLIGKIDSILDYSETYIYSTYTWQDSLTQRIISDDMYRVISSYTEIKREYLKSLKKFLEDSTIHIDDDFYSKNLELSKSLRNLNTSIKNMNDRQEKEYISKINDTIQLIEDLKDKLN